MRADAGDTLSGFKGLQIRLIEVNHLSPLAEAAFHQQSGQGFLPMLWRREIDIPEVRAMLDHRNGVDKSVRFVVDFRDDPGAGDFPGVAFTLAAEGEFLAGEK